MGARGGMGEVQQEIAVSRRQPARVDRPLQQVIDLLLGHLCVVRLLTR